MAPAVHDHGIMAQPLNPPPQPHQQEKPNSCILLNNNNDDDDFFRAIVTFHQSQQQNLQSPLNSVSGQHQNFNLDHSDGPTTAKLSAEPSKKKRGRPRKYSADGSIGLGTTPTLVTQIHSTANPVNPGVAGPNDVASSENPSKKGRGRPPGSRKQKQQRETLGDVGFGFMHHLINVKIGEDIASKVMTFLQQTPRAVCIRSATGVICKVTLLKFASGGTVTHEGRFVIASLSGSFLLSKSNGTLTAATPVQVNVVSFVEKEEKPNSEAPSLTPPDSVTEMSSPSPGAASDLAAQPMHGTLTAATPVQVDVVSFVEDEEKPNFEAPSLTPPDSVTEASSPSPDVTSDSAAQLMRGIPGQTM
ncbi:hypothetical protein HAX54_026740 [Datura stramonium]|uniref:AT-hook motif nuclear-localized protein n=1 Tax=Datura stramonium TaxID=4076 RepID=A0ABS8S866_DATST|nr:hypothetical protein [Datura stramonium]